MIPQETTLLLTGETGTGKTRLAQRIHDLSPRREAPFLHVDCGALSPTLIESELFGHVAGAFTGADCERLGKCAAAGRGTLLLDEITSLPPALQNKLLRVVDDRTFEPVGSDMPQCFQARVIVASSVPLDREVSAGRFRADLFYRLNVVSFFLPPLRWQRTLIAPLAQKFLVEFALRNRPHVRSINAKTLAILERYDWPGNIRELRNVIERAAALAPSFEIAPDDLPGQLLASRSGCGVAVPTPALRPFSASLTLGESKQQVEILRITEALRKHHNNRLRAAAELGISRMSLYKKLHKYGLMNTA